MTLTEFELLKQPDQVKVLRTYGVYLAERIVRGNRIYLYAISSFYVELFHELVNTANGGIRLWRAFDNPKYLEAYLDEVDISSL